MLLPDGEKWSILGYSFGGFCAVTYLSLWYAFGVGLLCGIAPVIEQADWSRWQSIGLREGMLPPALRATYRQPSD